jgi:hypothetical protein
MPSGYLEHKFDIRWAIASYTTSWSLGFADGFAEGFTDMRVSIIIMLRLEAVLIRNWKQS